MRLNPPKKGTWIFSLILVLLGIAAYVLSYFLIITYLPLAGFILIGVGWLILWLGCFVKGF